MLVSKAIGPVMWRQLVDEKRERLNAANTVDARADYSVTRRSGCRRVFGHTRCAHRNYRLFRKSWEHRVG